VPSRLLFFFFFSSTSSILLLSFPFEPKISQFRTRRFFKILLSRSPFSGLFCFPLSPYLLFSMICLLVNQSILPVFPPSFLPVLRAVAVVERQRPAFLSFFLPLFLPRFFSPFFSSFFGTVRQSFSSSRSLLFLATVPIFEDGEFPFSFPFTPGLIQSPPPFSLLILFLH